MGFCEHNARDECLPHVESFDKIDHPVLRYLGLSVLCGRF